MTGKAIKKALVAMLERDESGKNEYDRMRDYAIFSERLFISSDEGLAEAIAEQEADGGTFPSIPVVMGIKSLRTWQNVAFMTMSEEKE